MGSYMRSLRRRKQQGAAKKKMKVNFGAELSEMDGNILKDEKGESVTLGKVAINALLATYQDEKIEGAEKLKRFKLAKKLHAGGELDVSTEDLVLIKKLIGQGYGTIVVGQAYELIEGNQEE